MNSVAIAMTNPATGELLRTFEPCLGKCHERRFGCQRVVTRLHAPNSHIFMRLRTESCHFPAWVKECHLLTNNLFHAVASILGRARAAAERMVWGDEHIVIID
jgi:hypothetical protein